MRLLIFGAGGGTGRLVVDQALDRGHTVTAVARHLDGLPAARDGLRLCPLDIRDTGAVRDIAAGHDAAISVIGSRQRRRVTIYSESARSIVPALRHNDIRRFVCVSSGGVRPDDPALPLWYRLAIPLFFRDLYADMRVMEDVVRRSELNWTIVRSSYLVDKPARRDHRVQDGGMPPGGWRLARADLAAFLLDQLDTDRWAAGTPSVAY